MPKASSIARITLLFLLANLVTFLSATVNAAPAPQLFPSFFNNSGESGTALTIPAQFTATGFTGSVTYSISPSSALTSRGLSFNPSTADISGTPNNSMERTQFTITGTGTVDSSQVATATLYLTISPGTRSIAPGVSTLKAVKGRAISPSDSIATNFYYAPSYTIIGTSGESLPEGLSLNAATGAITGTPTQTISPTTYTLIASSTGAEEETATVLISVANRVVHTRLADVSVGSRPIALAVSSDGQTLFVANRNSNTISVIRTSDRVVTSTLSIPGLALPCAIAITSNSSHLLVGSCLNQKVFYVDLQDLTVVAEVSGFSPTMLQSMSIAISADGEYAYIGVSVSSPLRRLSLTAPYSTTTLFSGISTRTLAFSVSGNRLYVTGGSRLRVFDTSNHSNVTELDPIQMPNSTWGVVVANNQKMYVVDRGTNEVIEVETVSNTISRRLTIGRPFLGKIAISPFGERLYLVDEQASKIVIIDTLTLTVTDEIELNPSQSPLDIAVDNTGNYIYTVNYANDNVSIITPKSLPAQPTLGLAPQNAALAVTATFNTSTWDTPSSVQYSIDNGATYTTASGVSIWGNTYNFSIANLSNGTEYSVKVRGVNEAGVGTASTPESGVPGVPDQASVNSVIPGDRRLTINFGIVDSRAGKTNSYEYSLNNGSTWQALTYSGLWTYSGTVTGLTNGITYQVRVRARNDYGPGLASAAVSSAPIGSMAVAVEAPPPTPVLTLVSSAKLNRSDASLICRLGTYKYGVAGSEKIIVPSAIDYKLKIDGALVKTVSSSAESLSWDISTLTGKGVAVCETVVTVGGLSIADSSTSDSNVYSKAVATRAASILGAQSIYQSALQQNVSDIKKEKVDARNKWTSEKNSLSEQYMKLSVSSGNSRELRKSYLDKTKQLYENYKKHLKLLDESLPLRNAAALRKLEDAIQSANNAFRKALDDAGYGYFLG